MFRWSSIGEDVGGSPSSPADPHSAGDGVADRSAARRSSGARRSVARGVSGDDVRSGLLGGCGKAKARNRASGRDAYRSSDRSGLCCPRWGFEADTVDRRVAVKIGGRNPIRRLRCKALVKGKRWRAGDRDRFRSWIRDRGIRDRLRPQGAAIASFISMATRQISPSPAATYDAIDATFSDASNVHAALGFRRGVIVHSCRLWTDHQLLLDTLESLRLNSERDTKRHRSSRTMSPIENYRGSTQPGCVRQG